MLGNDTDPDGTLQLASVNVVDLPRSGTVTANEDGTIAYTANPKYNGTDPFEYEVCNNQGACDTATVTVTVASADPNARAIRGTAGKDVLTGTPDRNVTVAWAAPTPYAAWAATACSGAGTAPTLSAVTTGATGSTAAPATTSHSAALGRASPGSRAAEGDPPTGARARKGSDEGGGCATPDQTRVLARLAHTPPKEVSG